MIRLILILLISQLFLMPLSLKAQDAGLPTGVSNNADLDTIKLGAIDDLKNPFLSQLPPPPPKVEPVKVVKPHVKVKPKEIVKPVVKRKKPSLKLTGMVWGEAAPQAIINGKVVSQYDLIEDAKVLVINKKGVLLSFDDDNIVLTVDK